MPSDEVLKKLADLIRTAKRRDELLLELQEVSRDGLDRAHDNSRGHQDLDHLRVQDIDHNKYPLLTLVLKRLNETLSNSGGQTSPQESFGTIDIIRNLITDLDELTVEIPDSAVFSGENDKELFGFVKAYMGDTPHKPFVVKIKVCPEIISGLTLSYEGRYINLSLNKLIADKVYV